jgi:hypothetical protein
MLKTCQRIKEKEGLVRRPLTSPPPLIDGEWSRTELKA